MTQSQKFHSGIYPWVNLWFMSSVYYLLVHLKNLENWSRSLDVTWQPIKKSPYVCEKRHTCVGLFNRQLNTNEWESTVWLTVYVRRFYISCTKFFFEKHNIVDFCQHHRSSTVRARDQRERDARKKESLWWVCEVSRKVIWNFLFLCKWIYVLCAYL